jgi:hypothetical protein
MTTPIQTNGGHGHAPGCSCPFCTTMRPTAEVTGIDLVPAAPTGPRCACAHHRDGSTTTMLCPVHSDTDPCLRMSQVTGKRRVGSIKRGTCTNCGWTEQPATAESAEQAPDLTDTSSYARATQPAFPRNADDSINVPAANEQGYVTGFDTSRFDEPKTMTLVGHWDGNTIVVEDIYDGDVDDDREETGYWDQGLWCSAGTGRSEAEVAASMLDEYEQSHSIRMAVGEDDRTPDEDAEECAAEGCDDDLSDNEGYDGYCGHHAEMVEAHESGEHECACAMSESSLNACPLHGPGGSFGDCPECPA